MAEFNSNTITLATEEEVNEMLIDTAVGIVGNLNRQLSCDSVQLMALGGISMNRVLKTARDRAIGNFVKGRTFDGYSYEQSQQTGYNVHVANLLVGDNAQIKTTTKVTGALKYNGSIMRSRVQFILNSDLISEVDADGNTTGRQYFSVIRGDINALLNTGSWKAGSTKERQGVAARLYVENLDKGLFYVKQGGTGKPEYFYLGDTAVYDAMRRLVLASPNKALYEQALARIPQEQLESILLDQSSEGQLLFYTVFKSIVDRITNVVA